MDLLRRLDDWCGRFMNKLIEYDNLITVGGMAVMFVLFIFALVYGSFGLLGYLK
jgi:hypothetical protein